MPKIIPGTQAQPAYPERARKDRVQARVILQALVDEDGRVAEVKALRAPEDYPELVDAATEAVKQWRYEPARRHDGRPVDVFMTLVVDFRLDNEPFPPDEAKKPAKAPKPRKNARRQEREAAAPAAPGPPAAAPAEGSAASAPPAPSSAPAPAATTRAPQPPAAPKQQTLPDGPAPPAPPKRITVQAPDRPRQPDDRHIGGVDATMPVLIPGTRTEPAYPEEARKTGAEGKVILQAVIEADGTVGEITVLRAPQPDPGFSEAAIEALKQWRYEPGEVDGKPVSVYFTIVIDFRLGDKAPEEASEEDLEGSEPA